MRTVAYVLLAIITFMLQGIIIPYLWPTTWQPNLILTWIIVLTMLQDQRIGMMVAVMGGLVHDILLSNFFGLHLLPYVAVCYIFSLSTYKIYEEQWYATFFAVVLGTLLDAIIRIIWLLAVHADIHIGAYLYHLVLGPMFVNGLMGIVLHNMIWNLKERETYMW